MALDAALGYEACEPVYGVSFLRRSRAMFVLAAAYRSLDCLAWIDAPVEISNLPSVFDARACLLFLLPSCALQVL